MRGPQDFENPLCAQTDPEIFFPEDGRNVTKSVYRICQLCDHVVECAEWGIKHERFGVWGGLSNFKRRKIRRQRNIKIEEVGLAETFPRLGNSNNQGNTST